MQQRLFARTRSVTAGAVRRSGGWMATGNSGKGVRFLSGVGQLVRSEPRYAQERADVADSPSGRPAGVRAADTPGPGRSSAIMKLLSVLGIPRWIVEVHAVPPGSPW